MSASSPIRAGFAAIHRDPVIAFIEIAWRWSFGVVGTLLLLVGAKAFLAGLKLSEGDEQALRGHDPTLIAAALLHTLQQPGVIERFFALVAAVAVPSVIVWIIAATLGRTAVLKRLMPSVKVNVRAIFGLTVARAALLVAAVVSWYLWMFLCAFLTISPDRANYPLYLLLSLLALPVIGIVWGLLNWVLSFAPVLSIDGQTSVMKIYGESVQLARQYRSQFASISTWLGLPRLAAMLFALFIVVAVLVAVDSPIVASIVLTLITLAYCALADYLYVVRLAAYAQIARELPIATAGTPL